MSNEVDDIRASLSARSNASNKTFYAMVVGVVVIGLVGGATWSGMSPKQPKATVMAEASDTKPVKRTKAQKQALKQAVHSMRAEAEKATADFNETRMGINQCRIRTDYLSKNKRRYEGWGAALLYSNLVQEVELGFITEEAAIAQLAFVDHSQDMDLALDTVGKQLAGIGAGLKYEQGSDLCVTLSRALRDGDKTLPAPPAIASVLYDNESRNFGKPLNMNEMGRVYFTVQERVEKCTKLRAFRDMEQTLKSYKTRNRTQARRLRAAAREAKLSNPTSAEAEATTGVEAMLQSAWGDVDTFKANSVTCAKLKTDMLDGKFEMPNS